MSQSQSQASQSISTQKRSRREKFSMDEEKALCIAYVRISTDPIIGNGQSKCDLWSRITDLYLTLEGANTSIPADPRALGKKFSNIQTEVMVYVACLATVGEPSGTNPADWVQNARNKYHNEKGKAFQYDHCFEILRELPKYNPDMAREKTQMGSGSEPRQERPIGRKADKEEKRRSGGSRRLQNAEQLLETSNDFFTWHKQAHEERVTRKEEHMRRMEKKWDDMVAERRIESDNHILFMDTRHMTQQQLQFHAQQVDSIIARRNVDLGPSMSSDQRQIHGNLLKTYNPLTRQPPEMIKDNSQYNKLYLFFQ